MCFPSLPPQQQIEIKLRTPRSGDVNYAWNHEQSDANLMLNAKQHKNISLGAASFVGEIAQIVANFLQETISHRIIDFSYIDSTLFTETFLFTFLLFIAGVLLLIVPIVLAVRKIQ